MIEGGEEMTKIDEDENSMKEIRNKENRKKKKIKTFYNDF